MDNEKIAVCALNRIFGFEPKIGSALIDHFGSADRVFHENRDSLRAAMGPYSKYLSQITDYSLKEEARELEALADEGKDFITYKDEGYPPLLLECPDPPLGLYIHSSNQAQDVFGSNNSRRPAIAIVGTRDMSQYGRDWCKRIVGALAAAPIKPLIVSGLAIGIDGTAHMSALEYGLPTVAVMPTGIDEIYPFRHGALADKIRLAQGSALITDYPPKTSPKAINFLRRNRIIAGICDATILIESKDKGGGMMTARLAYSYDRDVYTLPGRAEDIRSRGCNILVRDKIAEPLVDDVDLVARLGLGKLGRRIQLSPTDWVRSVFGDSPDTRNLIKIASAIRKNRGISLEELSGQIGKPYSETATLAGLLESEGIITMDVLQRCSYNFKFI